MTTPYIGRYELVRSWWLPTNTIGPPMVLDRRNRRLDPYLGSADARIEWQPRVEMRENLSRWERFKDRLSRESKKGPRIRLVERWAHQHADCAQVAALFNREDLFPLKLLLASVIGTVTTIALDSNYVAGTGGDAIGVRYLAPIAKTINSVYFHISSYTGTAANVNDINLELRPESSAGASTPNTGSLTESKTKDPASATGWIASTGWTSVISALSRVFFIVGDADGTGVDFATVTRSAAMYDTFDDLQQGARFLVASTTGGWASGNSVNTAVAMKMVLGFADGTAFGDPLTANTAPASDTNRRGVRITSSAILDDIKIFGIEWSGNSSANLSGIEIYNNANNPGTSPDHTSTDLLFIGGNGKQGCMTSGGTPYTLTTGTAYRIVTTYSGATTTGPQRMDIGTGEDATLRKAMAGRGEIYFTRANGTSDWSNDLVGSMPTIGLLINGQVPPPAGSGGGMRLVGHGGLAA